MRFMTATFYVVPRQDVAQYVRESHEEWLNTPGKQGQAHHDSDLGKLSKGIAPQRTIQ